jgi:hypothetical protein
MWTQPTILRRGARTGFLHWVAALFKSSPLVPIPVLVRVDHRRHALKVLDDVASLIRKTW